MRARIQIISLALFTLLFFMAKYPLEERVPVNAFLKADPLLVATIILSTKKLTVSLWPSLAVLTATLILGRFFCGYLCPLGALIDYTDKWRNHPQAGIKPAKNLRNLKYYLLAALGAGALAGWNGVFWIDPIVILTRAYTLVVYPLAVLALNLGLDIVRPAAELLGWVSLSHANFHQPLFFSNLIAFFLIVIILLLGRLGRRFWCRTTCPLGALLGLFSRWALFRREVKDGCIDCGECQRICPMEALGDDPGNLRWTECTLCRNCEEVCPPGVISFEFIPYKAQKKLLETWNPSRRNFLWGAVGGTALAFFHGTMPYRTSRSDAVIRPPGAVPEREFVRSCTRCGLCMKACLTNTLQPTLWESGPEGIWTPRMDLRLAPCEQMCNACGLVCPTGAIRALDPEERKHAKVGTAVIRKDRCLVWERNRVCLICDEVCPYNAIVFRSVDGVRRPFVVEENCNGCGYCEYKCPIDGESAIIVIPMDEFRLSSGSYIAEAGKRRMSFKLDPGTDRYLIKEEETRIIPENKVYQGNKNFNIIDDLGIKQEQPKSIPEGFLLEK